MLPTALEATDLAKSFGRAPLFTGLSLKVASGLTAVAGRNGSGKTTLLKILAGLARPDSGDVQVSRGGSPLSGEPRRLAIGWAGPDLTFYEELTARENLTFFRRAAGFSSTSGEIERRLAEVDLTAAVDKRVGAYSTGMKQRLRLAFARLFDAPILLLDEPMSGLDAAGRRTAFSLLAAHRKEGSVVLASNDERDFVDPDQMVDLSR